MAAQRLSVCKKDLTILLWVGLLCFKDMDAQVADKMSAMTSAGNLLSSPDNVLQQIPGWKYSKLANSQKYLHVARASTIQDNSEPNDDSFGVGESEDGFEESSLGAQNYNVSDLCLNHTMIYLEALLQRQQWALAMFDAVGKLPSGVLEANLIWRGGYKECLNVTAVVYSNYTNETNPTEVFKGRYCQLTAILGGDPNATQPPAAAGVNGFFQGTRSLTIGLCLPDSCNGEDVVGLVNSGLSAIPFEIPPTPVFGKCPQVQDLSTDTRAIVVIVIASILGAVIILGTGYDLIRYQIPAYLASLPPDDSGLFKGYMPIPNGETMPVDKSEKTPLAMEDKENPAKSPPSGKLELLLLAFSIYSNGKKILSTKQTQGSLTSVHGVRFLSMTWVILGHTYMFGLAAGDNLGSFLPEMIRRWSFQAIASGTVSVDSFFLLSVLNKDEIDVLKLGLAFIPKPSVNPDDLASDIRELRERIRLVERMETPDTESDPSTVIPW